MSNTNWTSLTKEEKGATIRPFIEIDLMSYSQIAKILGVSRVAIAGSADRNGIKSPYSRGVRGTGKAGAKALHERAKHKSAAAKRKAPGKQPTGPKRPAPFNADFIADESVIDRRPARQDAWNALPGSSPVPLELLGPKSCNWPVYDSLPPYLFCNQPTEHGGWCKAHRAAGFKPRQPIKFSGRKSQ